MKKKSLCLITILLLNTCPEAQASLERAGDITQIVLPVAGASIAIASQDWLGLKQLTYSGIATLTTVQILKATIHRKRPNGHLKSFPSGHTAAAFWGAGFLQMRYGWKFGIPAYALATFTGYSRIKTHYHWTTDVLAGAAIGLTYSYIFTRPYTEQLSVSTYINPERQEQGMIFTTTL